jgi:hypothetical protein
MATKTEIFRRHLTRYLQASRSEKTEILAHLTAVLGMPRKAVIRALRREQMRSGFKKKKSGRRLFYTPNVRVALRGGVVPGRAD